MEMVPYTIGKFCGCDVVMDTDHILNEIDSSLANNPTHEDNIQVPLLDKVTTSQPITIANGFDALSELVEDYQVGNMLMSTALSPERKRKNSKSPVQITKPTVPPHFDSVLAKYPGIPRPPKDKTKTKAVADEEGFTQVKYRTSPRLAGISPINRLQ